MTMPSKRLLPSCRIVCFNERKIAELRKQLPTDEVLKHEARRHKALGHPTRQAIVHVLVISECCVCDLANILGKPVSTVSQHLSLLMSEGILSSLQKGKLVFYSLADAVPAN